MGAIAGRNLLVLFNDVSAAALNSFLDRDDGVDAFQIQVFALLTAVLAVALDLAQLARIARSRDALARVHCNGPGATEGLQKSFSGVYT
jgi:hypothetical protein